MGILVSSKRCTSSRRASNSDGPLLLPRASVGTAALLLPAVGRLFSKSLPHLLPRQAFSFSGCPTESKPQIKLGFMPAFFGVERRNAIFCVERGGSGLRPVGNRQACCRRGRPCWRICRREDDAVGVRTGGDLVEAPGFHDHQVGRTADKRGRIRMERGDQDAGFAPHAARYPACRDRHSGSPKKAAMVSGPSARMRLSSSSASRVAKASSVSPASASRQ